MIGEKQRIAADGGKTIVIRWIAGYQFYRTMHADDDFLFRHFSGARRDTAIRIAQFPGYRINSRVFDKNIYGGRMNEQEVDDGE